MNLSIPEQAGQFLFYIIREIRLGAQAIEVRCVICDCEEIEIQWLQQS